MGFKPKERTAKARKEAEEEARKEAEREWLEGGEEEPDNRRQAREKAKAKAKEEVKEEAKKMEFPRDEWKIDDEAVADPVAKSVTVADPMAYAEEEAVGIEKSEAVADAEAEPKVVKSYISAERRSQFERYYSILKERGPFDVDFFPDNIIYGMIRPYYKDEGCEYDPPINMCVQHAIDFARKQKKMGLEHPKVYRAHFELDVDYIFYISFKATDKKSGIQKHYETKIALTTENFFTLRRKTKWKPELKCPASVRLIRVKKHQKEENIISETLIYR